MKKIYCTVIVASMMVLPWISAVAAPTEHTANEPTMTIAETTLTNVTTPLNPGKLLVASGTTITMTPDTAGVLTVVIADPLAVIPDTTGSGGTVSPGILTVESSLRGSFTVNLNATSNAYGVLKNNTLGGGTADVTNSFNLTEVVNHLASSTGVISNPDDANGTFLYTPAAQIGPSSQTPADNQAIIYLGGVFTLDDSITAGTYSFDVPVDVTFQ